MSRLPFDPPSIPAPGELVAEAFRALFSGYLSGRETFREADGQLVRDPLRDLVHISLFTWRRAEADDLVPEGQGPQGWWADPTFGSKLWLLRGQPIDNRILSRARAYCEQALAWVVTDGIASAVNVEVEKAARGQVSIKVEVVRPRGEGETQRYSLLWGV